MLKGSGSNSLTFRDSGCAWRVDKNKCGLLETVAFGVVVLVATTQCLAHWVLPVNPTCRPNRRATQPSPPPASGQNVPPLAQPLPAGLVGMSVTAPRAFHPGNLDWLEGFLQSILSSEDFEKYKGRIDPAPQEEEVPLALQLAKKTKERGGVLAQIEHERGMVRDFETKFKKHSEVLVELMERKYTLEREIEELEALSAAAESQQGGMETFWPRALRKALARQGLVSLFLPPSSLLLSLFPKMRTRMMRKWIHLVVLLLHLGLESGLPGRPNGRWSRLSPSSE